MSIFSKKQPTDLTPRFQHTAPRDAQLDALSRGDIAAMARLVNQSKCAQPSQSRF